MFGEEKIHQGVTGPAEPTLHAPLEQGTLILRLHPYRTEDRDGEKCTQ